MSNKEGPCPTKKDSENFVAPLSEPMDEDPPSLPTSALSKMDDPKEPTKNSISDNVKEENLLSQSTSETSQLKKDDSGICFVKSQEDSLSSDESYSVNWETEGPKAVNVLKGNDGVSGSDSPDSGHQDGSSSLSECLDSGAPKDNATASASTKQAGDEVSDASEKSKPDQDKESSSPDRTHVLPFNEESTDLYDDDISIKSDDTCKMSSSDDEKNYDPTPNTQKPKHKWFVCQEVVGRQCGTSNRFSSDLFRLRCYGSLHMVERLELMYKMKKHEGCVNTLHFNSTGTRLVSGSDDLNVIIWDWSISEPVLIYDSGHRSNVFQAKFMPLSGDCHIVSCARDGQVRIAELSTTGVCKNTRRLAQHRGPAHKLALELDSPHTFLSCGEDAVVFEVDLRESKPEKLVTCRENEKKVALYTIFTNPSNMFEFAVGGRDNFVRVYDKRFLRNSDGVLKKYCPHHLIDSDIKTNVTCLVYNYNGTEILASYNDEDIYTFNTHHSDGADYTHRYRGHRNNQTVKGVNYFGPKSEYVVSGSDCGYIYLWDSESEHIVQSMHGDEGGVVNCLEPHPTCPVLATSGLDDDVKIWVPSYEDSPDLKDLKSRICANMKGREEDRKQEGRDTIDGQMLWFLLHHLRRTSRGSARHSGLDNDESSSGSSDSSDEDADVPHAIQCTQS